MCMCVKSIHESGMCIRDKLFFASWLRGESSSIQKPPLDHVSDIHWSQIVPHSRSLAEETSLFRKPGIPHLEHCWSTFRTIFVLSRTKVHINGFHYTDRGDVLVENNNGVEANSKWSGMACDLSWGSTSDSYTWIDHRSLNQGNSQQYFGIY